MNWINRILCLGLFTAFSVCSSSETCSSEFKDVSSCTILSDIVIIGQPKVVDIPSVRYNVSFQVNKLLKGVLKLNDKQKFYPISVGFFGAQEIADECVSGPLEPKTKYLVFLRNSSVTDNGFYRITCSSPVLADNKNSKEAKSSACPKCGKKPTVSLSPSKEIKVQIGKDTQVQCNPKGKPTPKITWYKDGKPLNFSKRILLKPHRRSSRIIIRKVSTGDQGLYECQAVNVLGASPLAGVKVIPTATKPTSPLSAHTTLCPDQRLCFNNGTCHEIVQLGRRFCNCPPGFKGNRCQEKRVPFFRSTEISLSEPFVFVVVVVAFVVGIIIIVVVVIMISASLRKRNKTGDVTEQRLVQEHRSTILEYKYHGDPADATEKSNPSYATRMRQRHDITVQTDCPQSASTTSPGRNRFKTLTPQPNGKIPFYGSESTKMASTVPERPHVSSSSSGTSPSEVDSGEYFVRYPASTDASCPPNRGPTRSPTIRAAARTGSGTWNELRTRKSDKVEPPAVEMKTMGPTKSLLIQETTVL